MKKQPAVLIYEEIASALTEMTDEQAGVFIKGLVAYGFEGVEPVFTGLPEKVLWAVTKCKIDRDIEKYDRVSETRRNSANKRWEKNANVNFAMQNDAKNANASTETETETETKTETITEDVDGNTSATTKKAYGHFENVMLTIEEYEQWKKECPVWSECIERLSEYMHRKNKTYSDHLYYLRKWYKEDKAKIKQNRPETSYDLDEHTASAMTRKLEYKGRNNG